MNEDAEIIAEFLVESHENLDQLERDLVTLEKDPAPAIIGGIFRALHTVKGTAGSLGFGRLETVGHAGENLLSDIRAGLLPVTANITTALLELCDAIRTMLAGIEQTGRDGDCDYLELLRRFERLRLPITNAPEANQDAELELEAISAQPPTRGSEESLLESSYELVALTRRSLNPNPIAQPLEHAPTKALSLPPVAADAAVVSASGEAKGQVAHNSSAESHVRVDVSLLDRMMNLVGELVLARNQICQSTANTSDRVLFGASQRLSLVTSELQEGVMRARMQPIGNVTNKYPRIVRDIAQNRGKEVRVEIQGAETELDRTLIEAIKDPLTHLLRNAVDHGIESAEERLKRGKSSEGRILFRASHENGQVNIVFADDGRGIDPDRIRAKALEKGLITVEQAGRLANEALISLIFLPGFSTADTVTKISGRGVGMDVVRTHIERIGGVIDIASKLHEGTTINIKIPLTLAIVSALVVSSGGQRYAIPQLSVLELVRLGGRRAQGGIEMIHGAPYYRLRGNLLPVVNLQAALGLATGAATERIASMVILQAEGRSFGLIVDVVLDTLEIVVKPLGRHLKQIKTFAGATIMGDGAVALILDVHGIAEEMGLLGEEQQLKLRRAELELKESVVDARELVVVQVGDTRLALPTSAVTRLEEFPRSAIERSCGRELIQYNARIMPLVRLADLIGLPKLDDLDPVPVVVFSDQDQPIGLVVDGIVDIVAEPASNEAYDAQMDRVGLSGSLVIQQKVTQLIDAGALQLRARQQLAFEVA